VGSITDDGGNGNGRSQYDFLMLRPNRILYEVDGGVDGRFSRADDLRVFVADEEGYRMLDNFDPRLKLEIILLPNSLGEETHEVTNGYFIFSVPGRHIVRGTYNGMTDEYSIEVRGSVVNPGPGQEFIKIEWL